MRAREFERSIGSYIASCCRGTTRFGTARPRGAPPQPQPLHASRLLPRALPLHASTAARINRFAYQPLRVVPPVGGQMIRLAHGWAHVACECPIRIDTSPHQDIIHIACVVAADTRRDHHRSHDCRRFGGTGGCGAKLSAARNATDAQHRSWCDFIYTLISTGSHIYTPAQREREVTTYLCATS